MALPVSLDDVTDELEALWQDRVAYVHRETGEIISLSEPERQWMDEEEENEDLDLDEEMRAKLREIASSSLWVVLPDSFEIHEWQIMRNFAETVESETVRGEILRALQGGGAFRYFKDTVYRHGIQNDWFAFKRQAFKEIARDALEEAGIPYR